MPVPRARLLRPEPRRSPTTRTRPRRPPERAQRGGPRRCWPLFGPLEAEAGVLVPGYEVGVVGVLGDPSADEGAGRQHGEPPLPGGVERRAGERAAQASALEAGVDLGVDE